MVLKETLRRTQYYGYFNPMDDKFMHREPHIHDICFLEGPGDLDIIATYPTLYLTSHSIKKNLKKLYGPFLWMGFNCLKARATSRRILFFTIKFPEIRGTHYISHGRMNGWVEFGTTQWF